MAEDRRGNGQSAAANPAPDGAEQLIVQAQYVKDLSFENPRAPQSLMQPGGPPEVQIGVDVKARNLGPETFEVLLSINASAKAGSEPVFIVELAYGAVVAVKGASEASLTNLVLVETPRVIFPFARAIIADATRDGGFPPLLINPIDFAELMRRNQQATAAGGGPPVV
jgi:preprotein translocase subunit SecB